MRPAAVLKTMGAALALGIGLFMAAPVAHADAYTDCVQACADQWVVDKQACQDQLDAALAQIATEEADCISNATNPIAQGLCVRNANIKRFNARRDYQNCISRANTTAYNCSRNCQPSDSRPASKKRG
ncbi:MAG: hypothetical protein U0V87_09420 [Acidobacteriota bacterium]